MRNRSILLLLVALLSCAAQAQTDPEGRQHAIALYEAYEMGDYQDDYTLFETLFMQNPALTKRAFVSAVEYMTEVYETDPAELEEAALFAAGLAEYIELQFQDPYPKQFFMRIANGDQSAALDIVKYAATLYPGYAEDSTMVAPPASNQGYSTPVQVAPRQNGPFRPKDAVGGPPESKNKKPRESTKF